MYDPEPALLLLSGRRFDLGETNITVERGGTQLNPSADRVLPSMIIRWLRFKGLCCS